MARNCDDHTKNFAFRLKQGAQWELAPAYDVTHAHNPKSEWGSQHFMSVNGKFAEISRADLLQVADRFGVGRAAALLTDVNSALGNWSAFAAAAGLGSIVTDKIAQDFRVV